MGEWLLHVLESVIGTPTAGIGALLIIYAIYWMARHQILLFGNVCELDSGLHRYTFFLQNLEEVQFPWTFRIIIVNRSARTASGGEWLVSVYAGPQVVTYESNIRRSGEGAASYWRGTFKSLAPFDTWKFVCETDATWLEFLVDTAQDGKLFKNRLVADVTPKRLGLEARHPSSSRFKGPKMTPPPQILVSIVMAVVLIYVSAIHFIARHQLRFGITEFSLNWYDCAVIAALAVVLGLGYLRIQRPVYPIIQGYFFPSVLERVAQPGQRMTKNG